MVAHRFGLALILRTSWIVPLALGGCVQKEQLPAYRWVDSQAALRVLAQRAAAVKTLSAQCQLTLTRSDGQSVRLDGAMAMRLPDHVRLRAWKLGQAVFDLTLTPEGLWVATPPDEPNRRRVLPASISAGKMARMWALFCGEFFTGDDLHVIDRGSARFNAWRTIDGQRITCEIERQTLVPRRFALADPQGAEHFELLEDRYRQISGIPWPTRLTARSQSGIVVVDLSEIEINADLPPAAFVPPHRAEKMP